MPLTSGLPYVSVQFSSLLRREESIVEKTTSVDVIRLNAENSRSAIIIFVPNLCRVNGRFHDNDRSVNDVAD